MDTKKLVVQIDGGMGRVLCSTPALEHMWERFSGKRKIIAVTPYPDLFEGSPHVSRAYPWNSSYLWDDVIKDGEFLAPEPYHNHFYYSQKHHLIESFDWLLGGEISDCQMTLTPRAYLRNDEIQFGFDLIERIRNDFPDSKIGVIQGMGASACLDAKGVLHDASDRSFRMEDLQFILKEIGTEWIFVNASHIPLREETNVWTQQLNTRQLMSVVKACDGVFTIDSFINHAGAVWKKPGLLVLGSTYRRNVGYPHYSTVQRRGFPTGYSPNRFNNSSHEVQNKGAMDFSQDALKEIVALWRRFSANPEMPENVFV